jgi:hypothetical protein
MTEWYGYISGMTEYRVQKVLMVKLGGMFSVRLRS